MHSIRNILKAVRNFLFSGLNKEFLIFLFFLALSGAFWLMMTLNETMEREYKIPMRLVGTPRNAVITGDLPDTVRITVRDKGFTLITYAFRPLNFKFNNYADETEGQGVIPVADVQKQILSQPHRNAIVQSIGLARSTDKQHLLTFVQEYFNLCIYQIGRASCRERVSSPV